METVIRALMIYFIILVIVRLSGRRTMAQATPFDFVLLLIVAETTQQALLGDDFSITNAVVLIVTLFGVDIGLSYIKRGSRKADLLLDGSPTLLVTHGKPDERALARTRLDIDDVMEAARKTQGIGTLDAIAFAVLETSGDISIIPEK